MLIGIARKYAPHGYMECDQCAGDSHQVRFASAEHKLCISCEQDTLKTCRRCDAEKPLTQFAVHMESVGHRRSVCKTCIAAARREKYTIGAKCCVCSVKIEGYGGGRRRYCGTCSTIPREKPVIQIKSAFNVAAYLAKPWRMSPC